MDVHFRKLGHGPLCWESQEPHPEAFMAHPNIDKVTCEECKALYYFTGKELEVTTASLDLWLDGRSMDESAGWRQPFNLNFERFLSNSAYAELISDYISRALENLAKELEEIEIRFAGPESSEE